MDRFSEAADPKDPVEPVEPVDGSRDDEVVQLREALASRTVTAAATGLLAARFDLTTGKAWLLLRAVSSLANIKLFTVARLVVDMHDGLAVPEEDRAGAVAIANAFDGALRRVRDAGDVPRDDVDQPTHPTARPTTQPVRSSVGER